VHILITGAAGMIGRKLTDRLARDGGLNNQAIDKLTLLDVVPPTAPAGLKAQVSTAAADLSAPTEAAKAVVGRPDVIFHLAGVVSGEAELDFDKGYRVNLDGTRALLEAIRSISDGYRPKIIYTSSIAVFGAPFPPTIPDDFHLTPLTSYGTQKAIGELLLADYTRRGVCHGVGHHSRAAGGGRSSTARARDRGAHPCEPARRHRVSHPRRLAYARGARTTDQSLDARRVLHGRGADRGAQARRRRPRRRAHPPCGRSFGGEDR
jgi:dTDP-4-dehydrorhamnose reductase